MEVQFYLIFPLLILPAIIYSRRPLTLALILVIVAIVVRLFVLWDNNHLFTTPFYVQVYDPTMFKEWWVKIYIQLYTRGGPIAFGIVTAVIYTYHDERLSDFISTHPLLTRLIVILALVVSLISHSIPYHDPNQAYLEQIGVTGNFWLLGLHRNVYALCSSVILLFVLKPRPYFCALYGFLTSRLLGFFAKISYSAYLFHILLLKQIYNYMHLRLAEQIGSPQWLLLGAFFTIATTAVISGMIYVVVEKPFIDLTHSRKP